MDSKRKIWLGCVGMALCIVGDYLLGFGTIGTSDAADAIYGMAWNVAPDWRYALSSLLAFVGMPLFAVAAMELFHVMEERGLGRNRWYKLFKLANWAGVIYFVFIHIGICMLPVVFNAGFAATGDKLAAVEMTLRVAKSVALPMALGFVVSDLFVTVAWVAMAARGDLPVRKAALICNPLMIAALGQLMNLITEGMDSGFESFGWLLMYAVCGSALTKREGEREDERNDL